jgi:hypothetical protein
MPEKSDTERAIFVMFLQTAEERGSHYGVIKAIRFGAWRMDAAFLQRSTRLLPKRD